MRLDNGIDKVGVLGKLVVDNIIETLDADLKACQHHALLMQAEQDGVQVVDQSRVALFSQYERGRREGQKQLQHLRASHRGQALEVRRAIGDTKDERGVDAVRSSVSESKLSWWVAAHDLHVKAALRREDQCGHRLQSNDTG